MKNLHRRRFLDSAALLTGSLIFADPFRSRASQISYDNKKILISGHIPSLTYMALTARAADYAVNELKKRNL
jgi:hypothetical protein